VDQARVVRSSTLRLNVINFVWESIQGVCEPVTKMAQDELKKWTSVTPRPWPYDMFTGVLRPFTAKCVCPMSMNAPKLATSP